MSKGRFKSLVDKKVNKFAFQYLKDIAGRHSKSLEILKEANGMKALKRKAYLSENILSKSDAQLLFKLRTKMLDVKTNFGEMYNRDLTCRTCKVVNSIENEDHIIKCEALRSEVQREDEEVSFSYVFMDIEKQKKAIEVFKAILRKREVLLKYQENIHQ